MIVVKNLGGFGECDFVILFILASLLRIPLEYKHSDSWGNVRDDARRGARSAFWRRCRSRGYATFCILLAKSRPEVGGGRGFPSL